MFGEIKKGVPVPQGLVSRGKNAWAFKYMEVGDSVAYGPDKLRLAQTYASVYGNKTDKKFITRKQHDGSLTIWRIA